MSGFKKKVDLFWASYADLMTSLFFIMLVLFVVSIVVLNSTTDNAASRIKALEEKVDSLTKKNTLLSHLVSENTEIIGHLQDTIAEIRVREDDYNKLLNLENTFVSLSAEGSLRYDTQHRSFIAKELEGIEIFDSDKATINKKYITLVDKVGKDLETLLEALNKDNSQTISYLLVIEGNTANTWDYKFNPDNETAYMLSYQRAMALYKRWVKNGIDLRRFNTEIQICGSGMNGINRDTVKEENNKRFVIQIIPKISRIEQ